MDLVVPDPTDEAAYVPELEPLGFVHWLIAHPEDLELYAAAKRGAAATMNRTGEDHGALGFGIRYDRVKAPVVREIYDRMFRAAWLIGPFEA